MKRTVCGIMLALLVLIMLTLAFNVQPVKSEPRTIIVPDDYPTIQDAINNAVDGDAIYVKVGTYYENVVVNKTILLVGESRENTIIDGKGIGKVLELKVDGILVSNFTITNGEVGIYLSASEGDNIEENIFIKNNVGVFMDRGYSNVIQRNNFTSNSYGVYLTFNESLTYWGWSFNNQILKNCFLNNTYGIYSNIGAATFINSQFNTTILENEIKNNVYGVFLYLSPVNIILGNIISQNDYGLHIELSSGNSITYNTFAGNRINGLTLYLANDNSLISNNITRCDVGIALSLSKNNIIYRNLIDDNRIGMSISLSNDNTVYNSDFVSNDQQVATDGLSTNKWNSTYPYGGNYWSDYTGTDVYCGPYQNETGSDGIGDTSYVVNINELFGTYNIDYYPLMKPCTVESFALILTSEVGGMTDPAPGMYWYVKGTRVTITAVPNTGFSFDYWLLDGVKTTQNPITVIMDSNHTLEAHFIDNTPPEMSDPWQDPPANNVQPFQNVTVWVNVTDYGTGIKNVTLWYSINNGTSWTILDMTALPIPSDSWITYEATIKGYENCTWITYKMVAYDNAGNNATKDNNGYGYKYHVIPEFRSTTILSLFMLITLIVTVLLKKKIKPKSQLH